MPTSTPVLTPTPAHLIAWDRYAQTDPDAAAKFDREWIAGDLIYVLPDAEEKIAVPEAVFAHMAEVGVALRQAGLCRTYCETKAAWLHSADLHTIFLRTVIETAAIDDPRPPRNHYPRDGVCGVLDRWDEARQMEAEAWFDKRAETPAGRWIGGGA